MSAIKGLWQPVFKQAQGKLISTWSLEVIFRAGSQITMVRLSPGVDMVAWSKSTGQRAETTTLSNGDYGFVNMKTARDYIVAAFPLYYPIQYFNNQTDESMATAIDLTDGNTFNINFQLNEGHVIQGNVYLNDISQTAPEGIWVNIWSQSTMTGGDIATDPNHKIKCFSRGKNDGKN